MSDEPSDDLSGQVASVGALADPTRWALYRCVADAPEPVSREDASAAVGLPLHTVKFHLDRLVEEGLLDVEFRRLTGRTGPGAGRPAKLYKRADRQIAITLPERRYDLAGEVLAAAIDRADRERLPVRDAVREVARDAGLRIAADAASDGDAAERIAGTLAGHGYEPRLVERDLCLTNCPFDRLAAEHTELVCGMNLHLVEGVVEGLGVQQWQPRLDPEPGWCCVKVGHPA
jgi:predicted ArsR family transcriptional regulator